MPATALETPNGRVAPIRPEQDEAAIAVLARAFRDNPLDVAVIGGSPERRLRSVTWGMRSSVRAARRADAVLLGIWTDASAPEGVLLALPSSALPLQLPPLLGHLRSTFGQGLRASRRWAIVFRALAGYQPDEPHWYLSLLGVAETSRRAGLGSSLLESWLRDVDSDRLPAYLETDREANLGFYRRHGFEVTDELSVLEAPIWILRRPPGPRADGLP